MPLIIAILVILVVFVSVRESKKKNDNLAAIREKDSRKTNARMEQQIVDYYMKRGYSFSDAYRKSYEDMVEAGYVPCIPRDAYSKNTKDQESSFCGYNGMTSSDRQKGAKLTRLVHISFIPIMVLARFWLTIGPVTDLREERILCVY